MSNRVEIHQSFFSAFILITLCVSISVILGNAGHYKSIVVVWILYYVEKYFKHVILVFSNEGVLFSMPYRLTTRFVKYQDVIGVYSGHGTVYDGFILKVVYQWKGKERHALTHFPSDEKLKKLNEILAANNMCIKKVSSDS